VGRLYREAGAGVYYVIGPDGTLARKVYEVEDLESALNELRSASAKPGLAGRR
jgi:hypothetical protein